MKHESLWQKFVQAALPAGVFLFIMDRAGAPLSVMEWLLVMVLVFGAVIIWLLDDILKELRKR